MNKPNHAADAALPPFARDVLALYASALAEVRFPDLDLAALRALADQVHDAQLEVDRLALELEEAKQQVADRQATLQARAERALAYARIYAEGDPALSEQVAEIRLPGAASAAPSSSKKRGRPRKEPDAQLDIAAE